MVTRASHHWNHHLLSHVFIHKSNNVTATLDMFQNRVIYLCHRVPFAMPAFSLGILQTLGTSLNP